MRQKGSTTLIVILILIALGIIGYLKYGNLLTTQLSSVNTKVKNNSQVDLTGIWQASGSMGSGWNDRYHFYSDGKYHFYPSQIACDSISEEQKGNWNLTDNKLEITVLSVKKGCDNQSVFVQLKEPEDHIYNFSNLETQPDDLYPSILFNGKQYWKYSNDPTIYGDEMFPSE